MNWSVKILSKFRTNVQRKRSFRRPEEYFECFLPPHRCLLSYWNSISEILNRNTLENQTLNFWIRVRSLPNQSAVKKGYCLIFVMCPSTIRFCDLPVKFCAFWWWIILATFWRLVFSALYSTTPCSPLELFQM